MRIALGDKAKDSITGFQGIVIAITDWLSGCRRILIQPEKLIEGKVVEAMPFDEPQVVLIKAGAVPEGPHVKGGPRPAPTRNRDVR